MKNYTILLFSGDLSKIFWTELDLLQDIRKFYGELFDVYVILNSERNCQSVAFIPLTTYCPWPPIMHSSLICISSRNIHSKMYTFCLHCWTSLRKSINEVSLTLKWPRYFYSRWCPRGVPRAPSVENHFSTGILQRNLHHICMGYKNLQFCKKIK